MVDQAIEVIRKRVDKLGTSEPIIAPSGNDRILVQIPGLDTGEARETREQLRKVAKLEISHGAPQPATAIIAGSAPPDPAYKIETYKGMEREANRWRNGFLVRKKADIPGDLVSGAFATFDQQGLGRQSSLHKTGADLFGKLTAAECRSAIAIVLDGVCSVSPGNSGADLRRISRDHGTLHRIASAKPLQCSSRTRLPLRWRLKMSGAAPQRWVQTRSTAGLYPD
jgi:preprotein translocase subunit SecD